MTKMKAHYLGDLRTACIHLESGSKIVTDAPKDNQGKGESFSPTDLFASSLATCILTIMGIYAKKLNVNLKGTTAEIEKQMATAPIRRIGKIIIHIRSPLSPNPIERERLEKAAVDCPVHHSLHPDIQLEINFTWGS